MSADPQVQQRCNQFLQMLPVTLAIAGLQPVDGNRRLTDEQMELRASTLKQAYKHTLALMKEIGRGDKTA